MKTSSIPSLVRLVPIGLILGFAPALQAQEELITPFMTLDWTFNTENLSAEFAVERIFDLQLGPQGELIVFGRDKIEVLDREGNPLCILRDDTGAEISSKSFGYVGPSGFITIIPNGSPDIGYVFWLIRLKRTLSGEMRRS
jgi:hypothetical protein